MSLTIPIMKLKLAMPQPLQLMSACGCAAAVGTTAKVLEKRSLMTASAMLGPKQALIPHEDDA